MEFDRDKWKDIDVRHEPTLDFEAEMYLILKSIKDDVSEIRQRLERLENKVNEEEQERITEKWNSIKMMGRTIMTTPIFNFDKRIKDMRDILTGVTYNADYIGQKGYFASHLGDYKNLDRLVYGKLVEFTSTLMFKCEGNYSYQYFLPESKLLPKEEEKYKAFSLKNWIYTYDLGDTVTFRDKGDDTPYTMLYVGYVSETQDKTYNETPGHGIIYLGNKEYTLEYLFEHFELWEDDEWKPFGIIDKEE